MLQKFLSKIKYFLEDYREDLLWALIIFLLVSLAFGIGFVLGSRFYEDCAIEISCPANLFEGREVPKNL